MLLVMAAVTIAYPKINRNAKEKQTWSVESGR